MKAPPRSEDKMPRIDLIEIHDHPRFPALLRDLVTDALQALWDFGDSYRPVLPRLRNAMVQSESHDVLDLCSGGGGPWLRLVQDCERELRYPIEVCLTDKYPNMEAFERAGSSSRRLGFEARPVDAAAVPPDLSGFRTMFSSFHHFDPRQARRVLGSAAESGRGIAIFEAARRAPKTILVLFFVPLLAFYLTPGMCPFRWSRIFWTYVVPVVPFVLWFDGLVSCLRAYSRDELNAMVRDLAREGYEWQVGEERSGLLPLTYVIGFPIERPESVSRTKENRPPVAGAGISRDR